MEHDPRLDKLSPGAYRMWHDGQIIFVPKGQSTTKPLVPEYVGANVKVFGIINKSHFVRPLVDFTSTDMVDTKRFDQYYLAIYRDHDQLPIDNPDIDYHYDAGLNEVHTFMEVEFSSAPENDRYFTGSFAGQVTFYWREDQTWISDRLHFDDFNLQHLYGDFFVIANPKAQDMAKGISYSTNLAIQETNLPLTIILQTATIKNVNSEMKLLLGQNSAEYGTQLETSELDIRGGE